MTSRGNGDDVAHPGGGNQDEDQDSNDPRQRQLPVASSSQEEDSHSEAESTSSPPLFARCKTVKQSSQDVSLLIEEDEDDESDANYQASDGHGTATTSQQQQRLRPPLSLVTGMSADSGAGDLGSDNNAESLQQPTSTTAANNGANATAATRQPLVSKGSVKGKQQQVKPFTRESLDRLESKSVQLVRDYGFQPRRKTSVEDGAVLPNKFEPFPDNLYGKPLEEIDHFIYDEVRLFFIVCIVARERESAI